MLSGVLRSDVAVQVSIRIMNTFVEMRHFIANNALLFEKVSDIELKQLEYQKSTDGKTAYHVGASIKDAGKKCFGISLIDDPGVVSDFLNRLKTV